MIYISAYVPIDHKEAVKEAIFEAGAGKIGDYDRCCFETQGIGQFRPLTGSRPFLGKQGEVEKVAEVKLEFVCEESVYPAVIAALRLAHPYESPAYYAIKVLGDS